MEVRAPDQSLVKPSRSRTHRVHVVTIRPASALRGNLLELWRERELLLFLSQRNIKVRYKQALAGPAWAVFQPLLTMIVFTVVFGKLAKLPSDGLPYPVLYYSGLVLWTYFANSVSVGANSIVDNQHMVSKVYFPRAFLPLSATLSALVDFGVALLVGVPLFYLFDRPIAGSAPLAFVALVVAVVAAAGLAMFLSALNAKYRDVRFVVPFFVQAGLFLSPVAYPASLVPERWKVVYAMNPMAGAIEFFRWSLTGQGTAPTAMLAVSATSALVLLLVGVGYFQRVEGTIADVV